MTTRLGKDVAAAAVTALVVLTYLATHEGWGIPLVGDSRRWATVAIVVLGGVACGLGEREAGRGTRMLAGLGVVSALLALLALVTASLTALSLLVTAIVVLWAASTIRHLGHPVAT